MVEGCGVGSATDLPEGASTRSGHTVGRHVLRGPAWRSSAISSRCQAIRTRQSRSSPARTRENKGGRYVIPFVFRKGDKIQKHVEFKYLFEFSKR